MSRAARSAGRRQRGAAAVYAVIVVAALIALMALVLNVGHMMAVRAQLQNACDAAALAGARELDGTREGIARARAEALAFAQQHFSDLVQVQIDPLADIQFGTWDFQAPKASAWRPIANPDAQAHKVTAILVQDGREASRGNALAVYFGAFLGKQRQDVRANAVAVGGGPCGACVLPFVFADCQIVNPDGSLKCDQTFVFSPATTDNIGFTNLADDPSVNPPTVINILKQGCKTISGNELIGVQNGNDMTAAVLKALQDYIAQHGNEVSIPIVTPTTCPDPQFNRLQPVTGIATVRIVSVTPQPNRSISIALECGKQSTSPSGCEVYGTTSPEVRLVR
jgi:hypothetical protein